MVSKCHLVPTVTLSILSSLKDIVDVSRNGTSGFIAKILSYGINTSLLHHDSLHTRRLCKPGNSFSKKDFCNIRFFPFIRPWPQSLYTRIKKLFIILNSLPTLMRVKLHLSYAHNYVYVYPIGNKLK